MKTATPHHHLGSAVPGGVGTGTLPAFDYQPLNRVVFGPGSLERLGELAGALGLEPIDPEEPSDAAASLKTRWRHAPGDRGADVVFQCRGQPAALHLALRVARPQATVIDLAFYQGGAAELRLGAEFHHNGLAVRCAQIGRVPRGLAHSWDRERLSAETIGLLRADGTAIREHLITAVVPFGKTFVTS